ncbi:MAG: competence type IV pilus major pilin ComGC [Gammaproteobacteria bacterium]
MKISTHHRSAFTLVEVMIVVSLIGLLTAIAIPQFAKARMYSQRNACIANLKQIEGAKATWAMEQKKTSTDTPALSDLWGASNYIRDQPYCPSGGTYNPEQVQTKASCSEGPTMGHTL